VVGPDVRLGRTLRQTLEAAARGQPRSARLAFGDIAAAYVRFGVEHPAHYRLMFSAELAEKARYPTLGAANGAACAVLTGPLERGQASGHARRMAIRDQALAAWSLVHGLTTLLIDQRVSFLGLSTGEAEQYARRVGMALFEGCAPKRPEPRIRAPANVLMTAKRALSSVHRSGSNELPTPLSEPLIDSRAGRKAGHVPLAREPRPVYDVHHMSAASKPPTPSRKEATHKRIVETAARAIRRSGYGGAGVADLMKEAGLTHGGFYAHFDSREGMLAEAADRAGAETVATLERVAAAAPPEQALEAMLRTYLSKAHVQGIESGCAVAALGSEMPRQSAQVRRAATRRIKEMIDLVTRQSPDWGKPGAHERALVTLATAVGALVLARAVDDPKLSEALREAALNQLTPAG
jgi:AcrR family transcriptional regulator